MEKSVDNACRSLYNSDETNIRKIFDQIAQKEGRELREQRELRYSAPFLRPGSGLLPVPIGVLAG